MRVGREGGRECAMEGEQGGEGMGCRETGVYMGKAGNEGEHGGMYYVSTVQNRQLNVSTELSSPLTRAQEQTASQQLTPAPFSF